MAEVQPQPSVQLPHPQPAAADAPVAPPKPVPRALHNESRFRAYKAIANEFVEGDAYDPNEIAHMLHDLRWDEVPRGFAVALYNAARRGPIRDDIGKSFKGLVTLSTFYAFAATERLTVQPWVLQNWDYFFVAVADGLLLLNQKNSLLRSKIESFRRSILALFDMVEAGRAYVSLDSAAESSGIHALLAASTSTRGCFIKNGICQIYGQSSNPSDPGNDPDPAAHRELTLAHVIFVDMIAEAILLEPSRDITTWNHAFGFYVGSEAWRDFASRCRQYMPFGAYTKNIIALENEIESGHKRLNAQALAVKQRLNYENAMNAAKNGVYKRTLAGVKLSVGVQKTLGIIDITSSDDECDNEIDDRGIQKHPRKKHKQDHPKSTKCKKHPTNKEAATDQPVDLAEAVMATVPNPVSPNGSVSEDRLMDQCVMFLRAQEETDAQLHNTSKSVSQERAVLTPRRDITPEEKPRSVASAKSLASKKAKAKVKAKADAALDPLSKPASPARDASDPPMAGDIVAADAGQLRRRLDGLFDVAHKEAKSGCVA